MTSRATAPLGPIAATLLVIGNVIGMGIFYTPGQVLEATGGTSAALLAWALGGLLAICGGLSTAECASRLPTNGGDYRYLQVAFGRPLGFLSGWASFTAGFPGSLATLAAAFALTVDPSGALATPLGLAAIACVTIIALLPIRVGALVNGAFIVLVAGILLWIIARAPAPPPADGPLAFGGIGRALLPVFFAYSGWNVVAYVAGECRRPQVTVPVAMLGGAALITVVYVLFNRALFGAAGAAGLQADPNHALGLIAAQLGEHGDGLLRAILAVNIGTTLLSTTLAGPRITAEMANRGDFFAAFATPTGGDGRLTHAPLAATLVQATLAAALLLTGTFEQLLTWTTAVMLAFAVLGAAAQIRLRRAAVGTPAFTDPLYPLPALLTAGLAVWALSSVATGPDALSSLWGLALVAAGLPLHRLARRPAA